AIDGARNVRIIDQALPEADNWRLMASVDTLVSLHRAEGFGLPMAEAMALGKPVVATGWSGNLSFMSDENSLLTDYHLVEAIDPFGVYDGCGAQWAEPDTGHAARHLKSLAADRSLASRLGATARSSIARICGTDVVGGKMAEAISTSPCDRAGS